MLAGSLYDKEIYIYMQLRDDMPVTSPQPLAIWTDGGDGTQRDMPIEFFALMMEDLSTEQECFDAICLNPERTMSAEDNSGLVKLQARIHDKYWGSPAAEVYPISTKGGQMSLDNFRAGLDPLEANWVLLKKHAAEKAAKHSAPGWGDGIEGWPAS
jgi:hypothetical protein